MLTSYYKFVISHKMRHGESKGMLINTSMLAKYVPMHPTKDFTPKPEKSVNMQFLHQLSYLHNKKYMP